MRHLNNSWHAPWRAIIVMIVMLHVSWNLKGGMKPPSLRPVSLRCEYLTNPFGIDAKQPGLSWVLALTDPNKRDTKQLAYQILVASDPSNLEADHGDLWDSGRVDSGQSSQVLYAGRPLASRMSCWWKVRVWDQDERVSCWSEPAHWSMGLLHPSDWQGQWISGTLDLQAAEAVQLRRAIALPQRPRRAMAYICGLGYYELYVNGKRVGDHVLDPAFTDYDKRVLYATYDVTSLLHQGVNAFGVILGNGWFHPITPDLFGFEKAPWKQPPKLLLNIDLEFPDGSHKTIASDSAWKWSPGPIIFNCIRAGETYDARLEKKRWSEPEYNDSAWKPVHEVPAPKGVLHAQMEPPMRVTETVRPVKITEPKPGVYLVDFGVNLTGWARLKAAGDPGTKITLEYNEILKPDGTLDMKYSHSHTYGRFQTDELILNRQGTGVLEPRFTYHGFRYVQITGLKQKPSLSSITAFGVHTDWESAGEFSCSNPKINRMQQAIRRTLSNSAHGMPGEEPTREKMGWTQDGLNTMEAALYNFDAASVYRKYLFDMIDAQEPNGHIPPIVPTNGWGRTKADGSPPDYSDPWWGGTLPYVAEKLYEYYGDRQVLEVAYEPMKHWVDYLGTTAHDHLVDWWLGDWLEIGAHGRPTRTPIIQTSTAGYYYCVRAVMRTATLLDRPDDVAKYERLADQIKKSFNAHFFDPASGLYAKDSETSQVLPLWIGLAPEDQREPILRRLVEDLHRHGDHMTTGFVGVMPLLHGLVDWGQPELAYTVAMQEDVPGFLQMIADGNSTMGESLDGKEGSRHHPFGACIGSFLFREVAGIRPDLAGPGFQKIVIRPVPGNLTWAKARYDSIHGSIVSEWKREAGRFLVDVAIPPNTMATIYLPARRKEDITESGKPLDQVTGVRFLRVEGNLAAIKVGSGKYSLVAESK
jgi:alpha-L-rhamnosidase